MTGRRSVILVPRFVPLAGRPEALPCN